MSKVFAAIAQEFATNGSVDYSKVITDALLVKTAKLTPSKPTSKVENSEVNGSAEKEKKDDTNENSNKYAVIDKKFNIGEHTPNATMRIKLAREWETLSEKDKTTLRSVRAKRGIKCKICGMLGVYRENCLNGCLSPYNTPPSSESEGEKEFEAKKAARAQKKLNFELTGDEEAPGLGVMWGNVGAGETKEEKNARRRQARLRKIGKESGEEESEAEHGHRELLVNLRSDTIAEQKRLQSADKNTKSFNFFTVAEEGYTRDMGELTLHQVLRRLIRLLQTQLENNASNLENKRDTTLLHPPVKKAGEHFYPDAIADIPEYRDYYYKKLAKKDKSKKAYKYNGNIRPVDELDGLFRGKTDDNGYFNDEYVADAGGSLHSKIGWKHILAQNNELASSDMKQLEEVAKIKELYTQQSAWVKDQNASMVELNDRFEHLIFIIKEELNAEHSRESRLLQAGVSGGIASNRESAMGVTTDKYVSMDRVDVDGDEVKAVSDVKNSKNYKKMSGCGIQGIRTATDDIIDANRRKTKSQQIALWIERLEAVDRIMLTLESYDFVAGLDEVDFILFNLRKWKGECKKNLLKLNGKMRGKKRRGNASSTVSVGSLGSDDMSVGSVNDGNSSNGAMLNVDMDMDSDDEGAQLSKTKYKKLAKTDKQSSAKNKINPYEQALIHHEATRGKKTDHLVVKEKNEERIQPSSSLIPKRKTLATNVSSIVLQAVSAASLHHKSDGTIGSNPFIGLETVTPHELKPIIEDDTGSVTSDVMKPDGTALEIVDVASKTAPIHGNSQAPLIRKNSGCNSRRPSVANSLASASSASSMMSMNSYNTSKSNRTNRTNGTTMSAKEYKTLKPREKDDVDRRRARTTFTYVICCLLFVVYVLQSREKYYVLLFGYCVLCIVLPD